MEPMPTGAHLASFQLPIHANPRSLMSPAWQNAIQTHLASLTQVEKEAFKAPASPEDCMSIIAKSQRRLGFTRVLEAMRPVLEPLRRFESVIDVVIQTNGGIGSPIWGPLKFAITVYSA